MPEQESTETTLQVTNETQAVPAVEATELATELAPESVAQPVPQKRTHNDRIAELESKIAKMEAIYQLQGQNVVDVEVCTDLLMKGYTVEQLRQTKPYLFNAPVQQTPQALGLVKQPPKVVAETQAPKATVNSSVSPDSFVKQLASMLISKF